MDLRDLLQSSLGSGYRLSRELGGGGMAKVFVADDPAIGRRVVVKVLSPDLAAGVNINRFKREIQVAVSLHHPRIVPVLSAGQSGDELLYYTMPYIEGETLRALVERETQLPLDRALAIARDVAEALQYAHGRNIVHRDIKPENILIERDTGRAVVTDFGIARAIERAADITTVTSTGLTLGTPTYMSPEQAGAERDLDGRSDIYSLGCVFYEMLAGAPPFTGPTARAIIARHMTEPPPPIRIVRPDLSEGVARLIDLMLAKVPAARFADADALARALDAPDALPARGSPRAPIVARRVVIGGAIALTLAVIMLVARPKRANTPSVVVDPAKIAVLYFEAPPQDTQLVTIARGLTRDLILALERVPELSLISEAGIRRYSAHAPMDSVARAFGVGTVVLGAVERSGDSVQVDVRLADARSLAEKGAVRGRYSLATLTRMRDTVVRQVAGQLLRSLGKELRVRNWLSSTRSSQAWQLRQRAEDLLESEQETLLRPSDFSPQLRLLTRAESLLIASSAADPEWSEPVIERGWVQYRRSNYVPDVQQRLVLDSALQLSRIALGRWPDNARALELRGYLEYQRWSSVPGGDPTLGDSAEAHLRMAVGLDPHLARAWGGLSYVLELKGDTINALASARRALEVDAYERDAGRTMIQLVFHHLYDRRYDSAATLCATARMRFPNDAYVQSCELSVLGWSGAGARDLARIGVILRQTEASGGWPLTAGMFPAGRFWLAAVLARSGKLDSARVVLRETRATLQRAGHGSDNLINEAQVDVILGEQEHALDLLENAVRRDPALRSRVARSPWFDALRRSPRFVRLTQPPTPTSR